MSKPKYVEGQIVCVASNFQSTKVRVVQVIAESSVFNWDSCPMYKVETVEYGTGLVISEYDLRPLTAEELKEYNIFAETRCECGGKYTEAKIHFTWCPTYVILKCVEDILPRGAQNGK